MNGSHRRPVYPREHMPCRVRRSLRICLLCLLFLCGWYLYEEEELLSPASIYRPSEEISVLIDANAQKFGLSRELLQAVILTESRYNNHAVSSTGAVGVMQLMPDTARWISEESGLPAEDLKNPAENIPLGTWYIEYLLKKYDGNLVLALAAYNAGRGNVDEWMQTRGWPASYADIDGIPFPETREFVRSVIQSRDQMREERKAAEGGE